MGALIFLFIWLHPPGLSCGTSGILLFFSVVAWELRSCGLWDSSSPTRINPGLLHWKHSSLAAGPPGSPFMELLNTQNQGAFPRVEWKEKRKITEWASPFLGHCLLPDASTCAHLGKVGPQPQGHPIHNSRLHNLFSTAQWTYSFGHTSWPFFRAQLLGPHLTLCSLALWLLSSLNCDLA